MEVPAVLNNGLWARRAVEHTERTLRQLKRLRRTYRRMSKHYGDLRAEQPVGSLLLPPSWTRLNNQVEDHIYFLVVSARQVIRAIEVLRSKGEVIDQLRASVELASWRDFAEHWDDPAYGKDIRALKRWRNQSNENQPGLSSGATGHRLNHISGIDLNALEGELKTTLTNAREIANRDFDYHNVTEAEAAKILGLDVREFGRVSYQFMRMNFGESIGLRYWRDKLENGRPSTSVKTTSD